MTNHIRRKPLDLIPGGVYGVVGRRKQLRITNLIENGVVYVTVGVRGSAEECTLAQFRQKVSRLMFVVMKAHDITRAGNYWHREHRFAEWIAVYCNPDDNTLQKMGDSNVYVLRLEHGEFIGPNLRPQL